jgi:hypothetical protein
MFINKEGKYAWFNKMYVGSSISLISGYYSNFSRSVMSNLTILKAFKNMKLVVLCFIYYSIQLMKMLLSGTIFN